MLACNTSAAGTFHYACEKEQCGHSKVVYCSCKGRACSACGIKQTEQWIAKQLSILPNCEYQHITLTMPDTLWPMFKHNPDLLNTLFVCGNSPLLKWAKKRGIVIGIFCVLHTFILAQKNTLEKQLRSLSIKILFFISHNHRYRNFPLNH